MRINLLNYHEYLELLQEQMDRVPKDQKKKLIRAFIELFLFCAIHSTLQHERVQELFNHLRQLAVEDEFELQKIKECEALVYLSAQNYKKAYQCYRKMSEEDRLDQESIERNAANRMLALIGSNETAEQLAKKRWIELSKNTKNDRYKKVINRNLQELGGKKSAQQQVE